jgi:glycosyltransferase involved in cell wall biosynthesis
MEASAAAAPAVSVVLPAFNRLGYLRCAVDSVFAQTFPDWELIIADDGSDEETRAYLKGLESPPRVRILWLSHRGVPAAVRNAAIQEARGEYIAFLDSDDEWMPEKLERQIGSLTRRGDRRWSYTGYVRIDARGEPQVCAGYEGRTRYQGAILEDLLMNAVDIWTPAVVVERHLLARVGGFDEQLLIFEDYDLWLQLASQGEIDLIDEPLVRVRSHDQHFSSSDRGASMPASRLRALGRLHRRMTDPRQRALIARVYARSVLDLTSLHAETDRLAAARALLAGCGRSWRYGQWWTGLPRVLLKLLAPRFAIDAYRQGRGSRGQSRTPADFR